MFVPLLPPVAIVILNWNGAHLLEQYLPSVIANTPTDLADIIVADNGSTDTSLSLIRRAFPTVRIIRFSANHGFARGYNLAITQLRDYPYVVLLNSDVIPAPGWLQPMLSFMQLNSGRVAAVQPKIRSLRQPTMFEYAGAAGGYIDRNGYPYCRGRIFSTLEPDLGQYDTEPTPVFWATGAALMVDTAAYLRIGGLDEQFFAHMEEIDLCWRFRLAGLRVYVIPQSIVYHLGGASLDAADPRKTYLNFRNNLLMLRKNLPPTPRRRRLLIRRRLLDAIAWARFFFTGRTPHARAIIRAHRDYRRLAPTYPDLPLSAPDLLTSSPEAIVAQAARRNILIDYYLRHRRTFQP